MTETLLLSLRMRSSLRLARARRTGVFIAVATLATLFAGTRALRAQDGDAVAWSQNAPPETWHALAAQPDGKLLVAGRNTSTWPGFIVTRFTQAGAPDPGFGTDGKARIWLGAGGDTRATAANPRDVLSDAYGRIYVGGTYIRLNCASDSFNSTRDRMLSVARLLPDGNYDPAFGYVGVAEFPGDRDGNLDPNCFAQPTVEADLLFRDGAKPTTLSDVALQPDGKVLVLSYAQELNAPAGITSVVLLRFDDNGRLDRSFGTNGIALARLAGDGVPYAMTVLNDGSIAVVGREGEPARAFVYKLTPNGRIDTRFGAEGKLAFSGAQRDYVALGVAAQPDGKLVISGSRSFSGSNFGEVMLFRIDAGGALDTAFGDAGLFVHNLEASASANFVAVQPDGSILAGGTLMAGTPSGAEPFALRVNANGSLIPQSVRTNLTPPGGYAVTGMTNAHRPFVLTQLVLTSNNTIWQLKDTATPQTGSLSTAGTPGSAGFTLLARNMNGDAVENVALAQAVDISGYIHPQSADLDARADLFVVAATPQGMYMRNSAGRFERWDNTLASLVPARTNVQLSAGMHVPIHAGKLPFAGTYYVYIGYRRSGDGALIYIERPLTLEVTQ